MSSSGDVTLLSVVATNVAVAGVCMVIFLAGLQAAQKTFMPRGVPRNPDAKKESGESRLLPGRGRDDWDLWAALWGVLDAPDEV